MTTELTAVEEIRRPSGLVQLHCVLSVFVWYESIKQVLESVLIFYQNQYALFLFII